MAMLRAARTAWNRYEDDVWACRCAFQSLPPLAKQYVMRMVRPVFFSQKVS